MSDLSQRIRQFYDASSGLWEQTWGEHMHHGYYGPAGRWQCDRRWAQIELIEELLTWAGIDRVTNILDVGCGIGGSTLYLAQKFHAQGIGITLSPAQVTRAQERAQEKRLSDRVQFQVADALEMPFADGCFDVVWSLESGEHMPNKQQFLQECYRVLQPGGQLMLATWCHRPTDSVAGALTVDEQRHLADIYRVYCLPYVIDLPQYAAIIQDCGFQALHTDDWSLAVAPFWEDVMVSALTPQSVIGLLRSGSKTIEAALSLRLMSHGYRRGLVRFGCLQARKAL